MTRHDEADAEVAEKPAHPCPYCTRSYPSRERLVQHSKHAHGKRPIERRKVAWATGIVILAVLVVAVGFYLFG